METIKENFYKHTRAFQTNNNNNEKRKNLLIEQKQQLLTNRQELNKIKKNISKQKKGYALTSLSKTKYMVGKKYIKNKRQINGTRGEGNDDDGDDDDEDDDDNDVTINILTKI